MITRREDIIEDYHGTKVADPYRWLENYLDPEVQEWVDQQNKHTQSFLQQSSPDVRAKISQRLTALWNYPKYGIPVKAENWYFYQKNDGLKNQPLLYRQEGLNGEPHVVLDPNTWSTDGTKALEGFTPSPDGAYLAYTVSQSGSDRQQIRIHDLKTGQDLPEVLDWCQFTHISWVDNKGFFYSRYPQPGTVSPEDENNYNRVYWHTLGTDQTADQLVHEQPDNKELSFSAHVTSDQAYVVLYVTHGTDSRNRIYYRELACQGPFVPLIDEFDAKYIFLGNDGKDFYFLTNNEAPRGRIIAVNLANPQRENWREIISEKSDVIASARLIGEHFVLSLLHNAYYKLELYNKAGDFSKEIELPKMGTITGISGKPNQREMFVGFTSYFIPQRVLHYDFTTDKLQPFGEYDLTFDPNAFTINQVFYTSKDGTRVPMFIMHKKDLVLDGNNPALLYGYGGFNISITPAFSPSRILWIELGGVYAVANIRGGSEFGEEWHRGGMLANKQNVFDDFIAAGEWLIANNYTSGARLAINGGSNGGLLVSACMVQRPELFGAVVCSVPVTDMLRFHKWSVGRYWVPEYGNAEENPEDFQVMYKYSPIHNAKPAEYPATLITTGDTDDRVVPAHPYKLTAVLQWAQTGDAPILLRVDKKAGHGHGKPTSKVIAEQTDIYVFLAQVFNLTD
jgi:prolyl oligopeptidase